MFGCGYLASCPRGFSVSANQEDNNIHIFEPVHHLLRYRSWFIGVAGNDLNSKEREESM